MHKTKKITIIIGCVMAGILVFLIAILVTFFLLYKFVDNIYIGLIQANVNSERERIVVESLNSSWKIDQDASCYFYRSNNTIYAYSFAEEKLIDVLQEEYFIYDFAVYNQWIFYLIKSNKENGDTGREFWKYNWVTAEKEMLSESIDCTYVEVYDEYLLYDDAGIDYVCLVDKNPNEDSVPWMDLFEENSIDGGEQFIIYGGNGENEKFISYDGIMVGRKYDSNTSTYRITCIREESSGKRIRPWGIIDRRLLIVSEIGNKWWFSISDNEKRIVGAILGRTDRSWRLQESQFTVENDRIVGILSDLYAPYGAGDYNDMSQGDRGGDYLFQITPINRNIYDQYEISIIYNTNTSYQRIIGYEEGIIYLLKYTRDSESYVIYSKTIDNDEEELLFEIPRREQDMFIDWCNGCMIIRYEEAGVLIYSVEEGRVTFEEDMNAA